jgi:prepilin-type processing-associated H-X9-DG protein
MALSRIDYAARGNGPNPKRNLAVLIVILVAALFLGFTIVWPLVREANLPPKSLECARNLRQIGQGIAMYVNENGGQFPDDLKTMLEHEDLGPKVMVCPASHDTPAKEGPTSRATANNVMGPGHLSYIYIGKGLHAPELPADAVIVYEPLSNHAGQGMNVLYGDFHIEWLTAAEASGILKQVAAKRFPVRYPLTQPATTSSSK